MLYMSKDEDRSFKALSSIERLPSLPINEDRLNEIPLNFQGLLYTIAFYKVLV